MNEIKKLSEVVFEPLTLEESFKLNCKVINLKYEYVGYKGTEQWAVVSELSKDELMDKYGALMAEYVPFILLSVEQGEAITEFNNVEAKYRMRNLRYGHAFDVNDGAFEQHHPEFAYEPNYIEDMEFRDNVERLHKAINSLSEVQKRRIKKYFFEGKTYLQISEDEGVSLYSIRDSIKNSIEKIKKIF